MWQQYNPKNDNLVVNISGQLLPRATAGVSPFDSSVQNGDAVWEGLRLYEQGIFKLSSHLDRLYRSADLLQYQGLPSRQRLRDDLRQTLEANRMTDRVHVRLTLSRGIKYTSGLDPRINQVGCSWFILAEHKPPVYGGGGLRLITAKHQRPSPDVLDQRIHSCNQLTSILAKLEANAAGADDALMLDTRGYLAETNATHVFLVSKGIVTTSTCVACPEGITRQTVLELCQRHEIPYEVRDVEPHELLVADELFCTGTMGELVAVRELDGHTIGGEDFPVLRRLEALFRAEVAVSCELP